MQPPLIHTNTLSFFSFPSHFFPALVCCHKLFTPFLSLSLSLSLSVALCFSLFCSFPPSTWLCPIAMLAKQRADETVLNSVICQHIQPRKLHCSMCFVCVSVCVCIHRSMYSVCDPVHVASVLRCILLSTYDQLCVCTDVYYPTATAP